MKYLPVGLDVRGRACVVVGGGPIGARKASTLVRAGADVTVVSPAAADEIARLSETGAIKWRRGRFRVNDLEGAFLAVAATDDKDVNARLVHDAQRLGILVCDASSADRSALIFGALHHRGEVTLAVFTDGQDPSLARRTRDRIAELGREWEEDR